jgi:excisionase family DNA binding protein
MNFEKLPDVVTVKELADFLRVTEQTIKNHLKSGKLKGFKVARDWRISKEAVQQWIDAEK